MCTDILVDIFSKNRDVDQAKSMEKYMRHHFSFLGIKTPQRKILLRKFYDRSGILKESDLPLTFIKEAWALPEREYHYAVLSLLVRRPQWLKEEHLPLLEELIKTNAWWDSVDTLASNIIGPFLRGKPVLTEKAVDKWKIHDNMWLRRTAILHQLKYKQHTNEELLYQVILLNRTEKEFFIQKAIGWALREYSKTNPVSVKAFIESEQLAPLSVREGLKHLKRETVNKG
ncbi:DNA alkylation repair protein [Salipaludibacillus keqinensis]|uniref:DNA alkylation repair protein n=1 Tax=Salipaludibacillus keqinensis TaxID=2045207 RepID=A0A323TCP9_9BACI|nr:DNA alkylation repair protein [Salipaludibacillus keqinensis]PYZ91617.1 DNA alkylation repair protein [Salipaludibacillus keqinensis]